MRDAYADDHAPQRYLIARSNAMMTDTSVRVVAAYAVCHAILRARHAIIYAIC